MPGKRLHNPIAVAAYGLACFIVASTWAILTRLPAQQDLHRILFEVFGSNRSRIDGILVFSSLVAAPLVESLLFPALWWLSGRKGLIVRAQLAIYYVLVFLLGLVLHGLNLAAVGRATAFLVLAHLFASARGSERTGYWSVVAAHLIWNATAMSAIQLIG